MINLNYNDCFAEKWVRFLSPPEWRGNVTHTFIEVPLTQVEHAGCLTDPDVVAGWQRLACDGRPIPPPIATLTERGTYYLHDGNHRFEAINLLEQAGELRDATLRIALVAPRSGFRFSRSEIESAYTYELQPELTPRTASVGYGLALLVTLLAILLTVVTPGTDSVFMLVAVFACVRFWGWLAGVLSTAVNAAAAAFLFYPPVYSFHVEELTHWVQLATAALVMLLISLAPRIRFRGLGPFAEPRG